LRWVGGGVGGMGVLEPARYVVIVAARVVLKLCF